MTQDALPGVDEALLDTEADIVEQYARRLVARATPFRDPKTGKLHRLTLAEARLEVVARTGVACPTCGHARPLDVDGAVQAHDALTIDYSVPVVRRAPCPGGTP